MDLVASFLPSRQLKGRKGAYFIDAVLPPLFFLLCSGAATPKLLVRSSSFSTVGMYESRTGLLVAASDVRGLA